MVRNAALMEAHITQPMEEFVRKCIQIRLACAAALRLYIAISLMLSAMMGQSTLISQAVQLFANVFQWEPVAILILDRATQEMELA